MSGDPSLPNFFIAGVPKAGTSSLHNWLSAHPQVLASREKETCFFADPESHIFRPEFNAAQGMGVYAQQFDHNNRPDPAVIFESTPAYIYQRTALQMIPALATQPRCLFVVREPAAQIRSVFSYYQNNWGHIPAGLGFAEYLDIVRSGSASFAGNELAERPFEFARYVDFLDQWRHALGPDRMKVITFETLVRDPRGVTSDIAEWLELSTGFFDKFTFPTENKSYQPRSRILQKINIAVRASLPKGALYDTLRTSYRKLNTIKPSAAVNSDAELSMIRTEIAGCNVDLAKMFDLDLSHWPTS